MRRRSHIHGAALMLAVHAHGPYRRIAVGATCVPAERGRGLKPDASVRLRIARRMSRDVSSQGGARGGEGRYVHELVALLANPFVVCGDDHRTP